jgi:hypothetical protein
VNSILLKTKFIGAFKMDSQIEGQIVVFDPNDIKIIAKEPGFY